jgi:hypothetical protein
LNRRNDEGANAGDISYRGMLEKGKKRVATLVDYVQYLCEFARGCRATERGGSLPTID